jgi:uncharacterized protein (TIGR02145 family)
MKNWKNMPHKRIYVSLGVGVIAIFMVSCKNTIPNTVTDIDGNVYKTIRIGKQVWMAENLRTTRYCNGDPIPNVTGRVQWTILRDGAYCNYGNNDSNAVTYGRLYNWYAVNDSRNIAPQGWHVPTDEDFIHLVKFLGGDTIAGGKLKEAGTAHWQAPNTAKGNNTGFNALPAGYRNDYTGNFYLLENNTMFWTCTGNDTSAWIRLLNSTDACAFRNYAEKGTGLSVRCVKD